ncbi:hypothetical protein ACFL43_07280, partial [Thermodesulfobacteriota bacterium]
MKDISTLISFIALVFSMASFLIALYEQRKLSAANNQIQRAIFQMERNTDFEGRLADWPKTFKFYGIDLEKAKNDNITPEEITFLVLSVNAMTSV